MDRRALTAAHNTTIDTLAVAAALAQPWADVVLSGAVNGDQLRGNVSAPALVGAVAELPSIAQSPDDYWQARNRLTWE